MRPIILQRRVRTSPPLRERDLVLLLPYQELFIGFSSAIRRSRSSGSQENIVRRPM